MKKRSRRLKRYKMQARVVHGHGLKHYHCLLQPWETFTQRCGNSEMFYHFSELRHRSTYLF